MCTGRYESAQRGLRNRESSTSEQQMYQQEENIVPILFSSKRKSLFPENMEEVVCPLHRRQALRGEEESMFTSPGHPPPRRPPREVLLPTLPGRGGVISLSCFLAITRKEIPQSLESPVITSFCMLKS